jgi:histidine triad (HIT) family protein
MTTHGKAFDPKCDFCRIANGIEETPFLICERNSWVAFFPLEPATTGHTLVVPKNHATDFWSMPVEAAAQLAEAAWEVGRAVGAALEPLGMNLITSAGGIAEQTVYHVHLHVVPRWPGDQIYPIWPAAAEASEPLAAAAAKIRRKCPVG